MISTIPGKWRRSEQVIEVTKKRWCHSHLTSQTAAAVYFNPASWRDTNTRWLVGRLVLVDRQRILHPHLSFDRSSVVFRASGKSVAFMSAKVHLAASQSSSSAPRNERRKREAREEKESRWAVACRCQWVAKWHHRWLKSPSSSSSSCLKIVQRSRQSEKIKYTHTPHW